MRTFLRCLCHACLLSVPCSIVVSFGSPLVRQVGRGVGGFLSRSLRHVACRGWAVSVAGRFSSWVLLVAAVSITSAGGVVPVVPLLAAGHSIGLVCLVRPVACFAIVVVCRHGLIVIGCCRRGSVSSSGVVACRRPACLPSGGGVVIRVSPVGRPPLIVSLIVSPRVLSPRLACRVSGAAWPWRVLSRPVRLVACGVVL